MKAPSFIVRVMLFAVVLAPFALRASARPMGAPSCRIAKPHFRASHGSGQTDRSLDQLVAFLPGHHAPAPRLHRIRGKKISIERGLAPPPPCSTPMYFLVSDTYAGQQDMDGPNPSRGPPSEICL